MKLKVMQLSKRFGKVQALKEVSMECAPGEIVGLLGRNGAGKTTLFKILFELVTPDKGEVQIGTKAPKAIGGIIEKPGLYQYLSAYDNLRLFAKMQGLRLSNSDIQQRLQRVGLPIDRMDKVGHFSMGMKQRMGIAIALLNNPQFLVLDEPFSGLDPIGIREISSLIVDLVATENVGVLIASHLVEQLNILSDRMYVLHQGRLIKSGPTQQLIKQHSLSYTIYGIHMHNLHAPKPYELERFATKIRVSIAEYSIADIIKDLQAQQIEITSCVPEVDLNLLFDQGLE